jgi:hypothetical protein
MSKTSYALDANYYKGTSLKGFKEKKRRQLVSQADRVHLSEGISPTIPTAGGGRHIPLIKSDGSPQQNAKDSKASQTDGQRE